MRKSLAFGKAFYQPLLYEVAADTPAGTYALHYASVVLVGNDYENDKTPAKPSPKIVVKRSSTPSNPAKPTINVTGTYTYTGSEQTAMEGLRNDA